MRLREIEDPLRIAVRDYIKKVYHYALLEGADPPQVKVLDFYEAGEKCGVDGLRAFYNIPENTIYFSERPTPRSVCHEIEHWGQCQRVGKKKYLEQLRNLKTRMQYEVGAMDVALANAHKLKW